MFIISKIVRGRRLLNELQHSKANENATTSKSATAEQRRRSGRTRESKRNSDISQVSSFIHIVLHSFNRQKVVK